MNKKIIMLIGLITLIGLSVFVIANSQQGTEDNLIFEVDLSEGWNIVASGVFANGPGIAEDSQIQESDLGAIFYYSPLQNKYLQVYPYPVTEEEKEIYNSIFNEEEFLETLYQIESRAAWVYSDKVGTLKFETDDVLPLNERQLRTGWNFVSITSDMVDKSLNDLKGSCNIERVHIWYIGDNYWGTVSLDSKVESGIVGYGVVIKVSSDCALGTSTGSGTSPPELPGGNGVSETEYLIEEDISIASNTLTYVTKEISENTCELMEIGMGENVDNCNTYKASYDVLGLDVVEVTVEVGEELFDGDDVINKIAVDYLFGSENYAIDTQTMYRNIVYEFDKSIGELTDVGLIWSSNKKVIMIWVDDWNEELLDDDVLEELYSKYLEKYPSDLTQHLQ